QVNTVSRQGQLPLAHVAELPQPSPATGRGGPGPAARVRRLIIGRIRDLAGHWRTAVDGLRPITQQLWARLDVPARRQVLAHQGRWERLRHRMAPELGTWLSARHG